MSEIHMPANEFWRRKGANTMASDIYRIEERLKEYDPYLRVDFDTDINRWVIARFTFKEGVMPFKVVQEPNGDFRPLDQRVVDEIIEGDMQRVDLSYDAWKARAEKAKASKRRQWENDRGELLKDIRRAAALDGVLLEPRVSMHVSDRQRRRSGLILPKDK